MASPQQAYEAWIQRAEERFEAGDHAAAEAAAAIAQAYVTRTLVTATRNLRPTALASHRGRRGED